MIRPRALLLAVIACAALAHAQPPQTAVIPKPAPAPAEAKAPAAVPPPLPHALEKADLEAFFDGIVPLQLERSDAAGATVLVRKEGKELLKKGYGFSDMSKKKPVDPDSKQVGSRCGRKQVSRFSDCSRLRQTCHAPQPNDSHRRLRGGDT